MSNEPCPARLVLTTCNTPSEAGSLASLLVVERLAACVTMIPRAESVYRWEGEVRSSIETLLLIKTTAGLVDLLRERLIALHSYQTPEFLVLNTDSGSPAYLQWLLASVAEAGTRDEGQGTKE